MTLHVVYQNNVENRDCFLSIWFPRRKRQLFTSASASLASFKNKTLEGRRLFVCPPSETKNPLQQGLNHGGSVAAGVNLLLISIFFFFFFH